MICHVTKLFAIAIASLVFCLTATGQNSKSTKIDWEKDLEYLAANLPSKHVDFYHAQSKTRFDKRLADLATKIHGQPYASGALNIMELVASVGDSHTGVRPDSTKFHYFPFNAHWLDDGIFVTHADQKHTPILAAKLVSIGGIPIQKVLDRIQPLFATDNEYGFRQMIDQQLNTAEFMRHAKAVNDVGVGNFVFEKNGKTIEIELPSYTMVDARSKIKWAQATNTLPLHLQKPNLPHWNDWLPDHKTLYFNYRQCVDDQGFRRLTKGTAGFCAQNDVQKFILDLRHNTGGDSAIFKTLFDYLSSNESLNQKGKLFVIVGRKTFSSGIWAANDMKKTNAIFVGEPTSGKLNHFGEIKFLQLPSSKLKIFYSTRRWTLAESDNSNSFRPDHHVPLMSSDYFNGDDPALEWILNYK